MGRRVSPVGDQLHLQSHSDVACDMLGLYTHVT